MSLSFSHNGIDKKDDGNSHTVETEAKKLTPAPIQNSSPRNGARVHVWIPREINIAVSKASNWKDETTHTINMIKTIGYSRSRPKERTLENVYWLPPQYNQNTADYRANVLAPIFVVACREAGFVLRMKGWEKSQQAVAFVCQRHRTYQSKKNTIAEEKRQRNRSTHCPMTRDQVCPFKFNVYFDETVKRWFLPFAQGGCPEHIGHPQQNPNNIPVRGLVQKRARNAYISLLPLYTQVTDAVRTPTEYDILKEALEQAHVTIIALKMTSSTHESNGNNNSHSTARKTTDDEVQEGDQQQRLFI